MWRSWVAFGAVCAGILTVAADLAVSLPLLPPHQRGVPGRHSPEEDRLFFEACVAFYGITYVTGRLLYRWLGAHSEAEELRRWSRWHMALLNVCGGGWLLASGWQALQRAPVVRPSMVAGALLLALAVGDGWRGLPRLRTGPPAEL